MKKKWQELKTSERKNICLSVLTAVSATASIGISYADTDFNTMANKALDFIFLGVRFGGIVFVLIGAISLFKAVQERETAPPNALPKALGELVGGIVMITAKSVLNMLGVSTTF